MDRTTFRLLLATAAVTALGLPAGARAQQKLDPVRIAAIAQRADQLDAQAAIHEQSGLPWRYSKAARLREQAASLRTPDDPARFTSTRQAAFLRSYVGQTEAAGSLMERAGNQALARGDVFNAATAYIDVAYLAARANDATRLQEFVEKGTLLMRSPLLTPTQHESLRTMVAQATSAPRQVAAASPPY
jgi:hypothetical protein